MEGTNELEEVFEALRRDPNQVFVHSNGKLIIAIVDVETDQFMAMEAPSGVNFATMSEEVLNHHIQEILSNL